jgi:hypothetical protein
MDFGEISSAENLTWMGKRMGNVVRVCSKVYQTEVKNEQSAAVLKDTNLQHARRNRTYNVASMPRSSSSLSSGKLIVCLTHDRGHPRDTGGEGFLRCLVRSGGRKIEGDDTSHLAQDLPWNKLSRGMLARVTNTTTWLSAHYPNSHDSRLQRPCVLS